MPDPPRNPAQVDRAHVFFLPLSRGVCRAVFGWVRKFGREDFQRPNTRNDDAAIVWVVETLQG